jgi:hypothetical protein
VVSCVFSPRVLIVLLFGESGVGNTSVPMCELVHLALGGTVLYLPLFLLYISKTNVLYIRMFSGLPLRAALLYLVLAAPRPFMALLRLLE